MKKKNGGKVFLPKRKKNPKYAGKAPPAFQERRMEGSMKAGKIGREACERRRKAFLDAYMITGTVTGAAAAIGVHPKLPYQWMDKFPDFFEEYENAKIAVTESLEQEAIRRARDGVQRVRFCNGRPLKIKDPKTGKMVVYVEHEYSDMLLRFLLEGKRPDVYRANHNVSIEVPKLDRLIDEELAKLATRSED